MSKGHWVHHPAIGGLIFALIGVCLFMAGLSYERSPQQRQTSAHAQHGAQRTETLLERCRSFERQEQPPTAAECEKAHDYADLEAQQNMVVVSSIQAAIGFIGLLGLAFTVLYARHAWHEAQASTKAALEAAREAKRSADIAERELTEGRRPRLMIQRNPVLEWRGRKPALATVLHNVGGSRAVLSVGRCEFRQLRFSSDSDFARPFAPIGRRRWFIQPDKATIEPGEELPVAIEWRNVSEEWREQYFSGKCAILVLARVPFMDHLGNWRYFFFDAICTASLLPTIPDDGVVWIDRQIDVAEEQVTKDPEREF